MDSRPLPGDDHQDGPDDVDARWAEIVAELGELDEHADLDDPTDGDLPPDGDVPPPRRRRADDAGPDAGRGGRVVRPAAPAPDDEPRAEPPGPRSWVPDPDVDEAENHFVPPDPGPVLGGSPLLTLAWVAVAGLPVLAIVAALVWRDIPMVVLQTAAVLFLAGVGVLLWRMPHRRDPDDDDPGAVV